MDTDPENQAEEGTGERIGDGFESTDDGPPVYKSSLSTRIKEAKKEGRVNFLKTLCLVCTGTIGCTIFTALMLAIPITMIVMGSIHLNNCPAERYIPIYLIVGGVFGAIRNLSSIGQRIKNHLDNNDDQNIRPNPVDGIISCFLFAWFIAGNVWIYRLHGKWQGTDPSGAAYCDTTLYLFAFWLTTATYILMAAMCCCACFGGCLAAVLSR